MHYVGQCLEILKVFSLLLLVASNPADYTCPGRIFLQPQECGARLITVTNQRVPRLLTTSYGFSQAKHFSFSTS